MSKKSPPCIAFVIQRCGREVYGGAEQYVLKLALACAEAGADVEIFSSRSDSYLAWNNNLPSREVLYSGTNHQVLIRRYPVLISRLRLAFALIRKVKFSFGIFSKFSALKKISDWLFIFTQGPWCPELWRTIKRESFRFDLIVCAGYLYAPTVRSLASLTSTSKTALIPMAHDEPEFFLPFVGEAIKASAVLGFLSEAECTLVEKVWADAKLRRTIFVPPGLSFSGQYHAEESGRFSFLPKRYLLYVGRVDHHKGVDFLVQHTPSTIPLVFAGENHTKYASVSNLYFLGRVTDLERDVLIKNAAALVIASRFESYSMVTADALSFGTMVLALKGCAPVDELIGLYGGVSCSSEEFSSWAQKLHNGDDIAEDLLPKSAKIKSERSWACTAATLLSLASE